MTREEFELFDTTEQQSNLDVRKLICRETIKAASYTIIPCAPVTGTLFITDNNPSFISGQARLRGKNEGRYPYHYLEMIDNIFGYEPNTIEVCSRSVPGGNKGGHCFTVDINPDCKPDLVTDGETLEGTPSNEFNRWRCDPPYNENTAIKMYRTKLPKTSELLKAGARVCKEGGFNVSTIGPYKLSIMSSRCDKNWFCCTVDNTKQRMENT